MISSRISCVAAVHLFKNGEKWKSFHLMIKLMVVQISLVFFAFALAFILAVIFRRMSRRLLTRPAKNEWTLCQEHFVHSSVYALPDWRWRLLSSNELTVEFFFFLGIFHPVTSHQFSSIIKYQSENMPANSLL